MTFKKLFTFATALVLALNSSAYAGSKKLIYAGPYDTGVQKVYFLNKKLIYKTEYKEALYKVNLEVHNQAFSSGRKGVTRVTELVHCSILQPYIATKGYSDGTGNTKGSIHYINPKGDPNDLRMVGDRLAWEYWTICHNIPNVTQSDLATLSLKYGYKNNLEFETKEIPDSLERYLR